MTETIRRAVLNSGLPMQQVAVAAGVDRASLSRFVRGERSLRLDMADRLAAYFGLELRQTQARGGREPTRRKRSSSEDG